jgi:apolipoprotein N-acyltransferase
MENKMEPPTYKLRASVMAVIVITYLAGTWWISDSIGQFVGWLVVLAFFVFWYWRLSKAQSLHPRTRGYPSDNSGIGGTGGIGAS